MHSDERLCLVYDPKRSDVFLVWLTDSRPCQSENLPGINTLLDEFVRQRAEEDARGEDGTDEEEIYQSFFHDHTQYF